ncbi:hypothetical protein AMELA_G00213310 [Ameiurus melas]|uniref:Uncharacterized protein n=1 Tax=Ameiurus melas TaxID=219545 RepID=A0A7J6A2C2_AMEME|nr:hypothetical protein AMELA_G00213310 [Ameiurus melas]
MTFWYILLRDSGCSRVPACVLVWGFLRVLQFPKNMPVDEWAMLNCSAMVLHPSQCVFLPHAQCSQTRMLNTPPAGLTPVTVSRDLRHHRKTIHHHLPSETLNKLPFRRDASLRLER